MLGHFSWGWLGGGLFWQISAYGHSAVIVFFVLSGYVIAFSAETKDASFGDYAINRAARVLSVATPALLLTAILDAIGSAINPGFYAYYASLAPPWSDFGGNQSLQFVFGQLFLNELWFLHVPVMTDRPYWSLSYEVWYYVAFGFIYYMRGRQRIFLSSLTFSIAGPKILLLLPIWAFGVFGWRYRNRLPECLAWPLFCISLVAMIILNLHVVDHLFEPARSLYWPFDYKLSDHLLGLAFALHIAAAARLPSIPGIEWLKTPIRRMAGLTFSIYLYHLPILLFLGAVLPGLPTDWQRRMLMLAVTFLAIAWLGRFTEQKKHLFKGWLVSAQRLRFRWAEL